EQCLPGSWRTDQQCAAWDASAQAIKLLRGTQELHNLLQFHAHLVNTGNIRERRRRVQLQRPGRIGAGRGKRRALRSAGPGGSTHRPGALPISGSLRHTTLKTADPPSGKLSNMLVHILWNTRLLARLEN